MAEWSNAPDSKSGVQVLLYRGFESLSFRQYKAFLYAQLGCKNHSAHSHRQTKVSFVERQLGWQELLKPHK